jgi:hypothetical protein
MDYLGGSFRAAVFSEASSPIMLLAGMDSTLDLAIPYFPESAKSFLSCSLKIQCNCSKHLLEISFTYFF